MNKRVQLNKYNSFVSIFK